MCGKLKNSILKSLCVITLYCILCNSLVVQAYDLSAPHPDVNKETDVNETKERLWKAIRKWGYSEEATAAVMGNIEAECSYNYTAIEDSRGWGNFQYEKYGLGLIQWTSEDRQKALFAMADSMGKQWTDLDVQISELKYELDNWGNWWSYGGTCSSYEEFKKLKNIDVATAIVCFGFERPRPETAHMDRRINSANEAFNQFTGSSIEDDEDNGSGELENINGIISEWSLPGMSSSQSGFLNDYDKPELPKYEDLSAGNKYSLSVVKDNLVTNKEYQVYDLIRTGVTFIGLCIIIYAVLLIASYIFDRTNNLLDISLLSIISFGRLTYYDGDDGLTREGHTNGSRIVRSACICFGVGFFIVSGGVFAWVLDIYFWIVKGVF